MQRSSSAPNPDPSWRTLYRLGAAAACVAVLLYILALVLFVTTTAPPSSGAVATLEHVAAHRSVYLLKQVLWLAPNPLLMTFFLALAISLARVSKGLAAVAGMVSVASWAVPFAWPTTGEGSLGMVVLSDRYAAATTDAERASLVAGAELLLVLNDLPAVLIGVLEALGLLLIALLMTRSTFPRWLAWLGVGTGALGIASEALRPQLGWAYALYGVMLFIWLSWAAVALWRVASRIPARSHERADANARRLAVG